MLSSLEGERITAEVEKGYRGDMGNKGVLDLFNTDGDI